jgi:hypothetical protein
MMAGTKSGLPVVAYWRFGWPGLRPAMTVTARAVTATTDPAMMDPAMMDKGLLA